MDIRTAITSAIALAKAGAVVFPPLAAGAELAQKTLDVLAGLQEHSPDDRTTDQIEAAHAELYNAMTAKGHALSDRLRGS